MILKKRNKEIGTFELVTAYVMIVLLIGFIFISVLYSEPSKYRGNFNKYGSKSYEFDMEKNLADEINNKGWLYYPKLAISFSVKAAIILASFGILIWLFFKLLTYIMIRLELLWCFGLVNTIRIGRMRL